MQYFYATETSFYRKKRCCGDLQCFEKIDEKIKTFNYKKKQSRIAKGTFRNGVAKEIREKILERDGYRCRLCKFRDKDAYSMQVHHVVPVSHGGDDDDLNLCILCKSCHQKVHNDGWEKYVITFKTTSEAMGARAS